MHVSPLDVAWWCNALGSLATVLVMFVAILCSNWDRLAREHAEELAGLEVRPNDLGCDVFLQKDKVGALAGRGATAGSRTRCTCRPRFGACGRWEKAPMRLRSAGHGAGGPLTELACVLC